MSEDRGILPGPPRQAFQSFLSPREARWFLACWGTYVLAYIARVNLSAGIARVAEAFDTTTEVLGHAGSVFFVVYAVGQLLNGFRGDRRSPRRSIAGAMLGISLSNVLIPFVHRIEWLIVLWGINGYFQSWLWGPLIRVLSAKYPKRLHGWLSAGMSTSMVMGFMLGWFFLGYALFQSPWTLNFFIPSVLSAAVCIGWFAWGKTAAIPGMAATLRRTGRRWARHVIAEMRKAHLSWGCAACFCLGLVKEGLSFWMPLLLSRAMGIDIKHSFVYILFIPLANIGGIALAGVLSRRLSSGMRSALGCLFGALGVGALILLVCPEASWAMLILFALISAASYGCNSLLLGAVPLRYGQSNMASSVAGVFDFCSYVGASLSVFVLGRLIAESNWRVMAVVWLLAAAGGVCASQVGRARRRKVRETPSEKGVSS